ncbi:MAG: hypothetical protein B7Y90_08130 [Alphaproteobacteria bacterium 32-64-14]|nr:MAG: hypothetical protein B7Y90_08130 [Alphaproteobacteria bacterium 32-64-14]
MHKAKPGSIYGLILIFLLVFGLMANVIAVAALSAMPAFGISPETSVWVLASYFWFLALVELSPWPYLGRDDGKHGIIGKLVAAVTLAAMLHYFIVDAKLGHPIGVLAIVPGLSVYLLRLLLRLKGVELWKPRRSDSPR